MNFSLLRCLRCPFCAGNFGASEIEEKTGKLEFTVLTCGCSRFPVVAGIPIFRKGAIGVAGEDATDIIGLIENGQHRDALLSMIKPPSPGSPTLAPAWIRKLPSVKGIRRLKHLSHKRALPSWREQTTNLMTNPESRITARDLFELYRWQNRESYNYFAYRLGQPRHLISLSFASLIREPKKLILDLACGFGHITRGLVQRAKGQPVVGMDLNFKWLYVAKYRVAPEADYVCGEANAPLPFVDDTFSAVLCSDAFHYIDDKTTCIRELKRVTQVTGLIMLVVLRNALLAYPYAGKPLSPEGYGELVADMGHSIVADSAVLARYLHKQGPALARSFETQQLAHEPTLSLLASHSHEVFRDYGPFEDWPHADGRLGLNPLYTVEIREQLGKVDLRRSFPTDFYERDNAECKQYLPEAVSVDSDIVRHLAQGERTPEVENLIERCVALGFPEQYW